MDLDLNMGVSQPSPRKVSPTKSELNIIKEEKNHKTTNLKSNKKKIIPMSYLKELKTNLNSSFEVIPIKPEEINDEDDDEELRNAPKPLNKNDLNCSGSLDCKDFLKVNDFKKKNCPKKKESYSVFNDYHARRVVDEIMKKKLQL